jgi:hypothetical protein
MPDTVASLQNLSVALSSLVTKLAPHVVSIYFGSEPTASIQTGLSDQPMRRLFNLVMTLNLLTTQDKGSSKSPSNNKRQRYTVHATKERRTPIATRAPPSLCERFGGAYRVAIVVDDSIDRNHLANTPAAAAISQSMR